MNDSVPQPHNGEISFSELIMKLWEKRGLILLLPLVFAGLTITSLLATKATAPDTLTYYIELVGIETRLGETEGNSVPSSAAAGAGTGSAAGAGAAAQQTAGSQTRYPNGTAFSPQDLLNPEVTARLAAKFSIENGQHAAEGISVRYGTPLTEGLIKEYQAALAASSKATAEELAEIASRYDQRIRSAARRGLRIDVDYSALGTDASTGKLVAQALPLIWNEVYATRFRIFIDSGVLGLSLADDSEASIATTVGAIEADLQLRGVTKGVELLRDDARFRALRSESGATPAELAQRITDFRSIYFEPIYSSSFASDDSLARVYRRDLELSMKELDIALDELNARIDTITELQTRGASAGGATTMMGRDSSQVQIGGDSLGQLVDLSRQASLAEYLTTSFDLRLELVTSKADLTTRYEKMIANSAVNTANMLSAEFVQSAEARLTTILAEYSSLLMTAQAMALSETPSLYQAMSEVTDSAGTLVEKRDLLFTLLAIALGVMIAVIFALVSPQRQA